MSRQTSSRSSGGGASQPAPAQPVCVVEGSTAHLHAEMPLSTSASPAQWTRSRRVSDW